MTGVFNYGLPGARYFIAEVLAVFYGCEFVGSSRDHKGREVDCGHFFHEVELIADTVIPVDHLRRCIQHDLATLTDQVIGSGRTKGPQADDVDGGFEIRQKPIQNIRMNL